MAAQPQVLKNLLTAGSDKKTVVFGCYVYSEGIGDLMHISNNETANQYYRHMGFSINQYGIFINPPKDSLTKPECLSSIKDKVFLSLLLKSSTRSRDVKACHEFLNLSFLLPGYFQEGMATFMAFEQ